MTPRSAKCVFILGRREYAIDGDDRGRSCPWRWPRPKRGQSGQVLEAESVGAMQLAASQPVVSSGNSARGSEAYPCVTDPYYVPMMCRGFNSGQMSLQCREREIKSQP